MSGLRIGGPSGIVISGSGMSVGGRNGLQFGTPDGGSPAPFSGASGPIAGGLGSLTGLIGRLTPLLALLPEVSTMASMITALQAILDLLPGGSSAVPQPSDTWGWVFPGTVTPMGNIMQALIKTALYTVDIGAVRLNNNANFLLLMQLGLWPDYGEGPAYPYVKPNIQHVGPKSNNPGESDIDMLQRLLPDWNFTQSDTVYGGLPLGNGPDGPFGPSGVYVLYAPIYPGAPTLEKINTLFEYYPTAPHVLRNALVDALVYLTGNPAIGSWSPP